MSTEQDDLKESLRLLCVMFDTYENGASCYDGPDDCAGYIGNAVRLSDVDFQAIVDILNRLCPQDSK